MKVPSGELQDDWGLFCTWARGFFPSSNPVPMTIGWGGRGCEAGVKFRIERPAPIPPTSQARLSDDAASYARLVRRPSLTQLLQWQAGSANLCIYFIAATPHPSPITTHVTHSVHMHAPSRAHAQSRHASCEPPVFPSQKSLGERKGMSAE